MLLSATPESGLSTYVPVEQGTVNTTTSQNPSAVVISGLQPVLPQGGLVYETSINNTLVSSSDLDIYNLAIDPNQTLGVVVSPSSSSLSLSVSLYSPSGTLLATATSPSPGAAAVLGGVQSSQGGTYQIQVSGGPGEYTILPVLNAFVDPEGYGGTPHDSIATAAALDTYANNVAGQDNRTAALGTILGSPASFGDALAINGSSTPALGSSSVILVDHKTGTVLKTYTSQAFSNLSLYDVKLAADNTFWVLGARSGAPGVLVHMDLAGDTLGTIVAPVSDTAGYISPEGFAIDPRDGSFWLPLFNSGNIVHLDPSGKLLGEFNVGGNPIDDAVGPDGKIYISQHFQSEIQTLDPSTGVTGVFASSPNPFDLTWSVAGDLWVGDASSGAQEFDSSGKLLNVYDGIGVIAAEPALSGNVWDTNVSKELVKQYSASGTLLTSTPFNPNTSQPGLAVFGDVAGEQALQQPQTPVYSFALKQGQSATMALQILAGKGASFALYDQSGDLLAVSSTGATNYSQGLNNFVAPKVGTYYVQVTGYSGTQFNLVVTRGADFSTQNHTTPGSAQDISATQQSGNSNLGGALGDLSNPSGAQVGASFNGLSYDDSPCGCWPPNDIVAAGPTQVMEAVNTVFRIVDKSGDVLAQEDFSQFWAPLGITASSFISDPYVVYDPIAGRFYVTMLGGPNNSHLDMLFAASKDSNPTDGFSVFGKVHIGANDNLDFPKVGFNYDTVMLEANDFVGGSNPSETVFAAIDKSQLLQGNFVDYVYELPGYPQNFRATVPAQMDDAKPGDPMYFVQEDGYENGNAAEIVTLTGALSNNPNFTDTVIPVDPYGPTVYSDQPGSPGSVQSIDNSFVRAEWRNGMLVATQTVTTPGDGGQTDHVRWYEFSVPVGGTPSLVQQGTIAPGPGIATYNGNIAINANGALGLTYMQSSLTQYVSIYVAGQVPGASLGTLGPGVLAEAGSLSQPQSTRTGDYSGIAVDPSDGTTFWAINQYYGPDISNVWNTWVASFQVLQTVSTDYYSVNVSAGNQLQISTTTPSGGPNEFANNLDPELKLFDNNGNLVATAAGNAADGRNAVIDYSVPAAASGKWVIEVEPSQQNVTLTSGEYGLLVTGATGGLSSFVVAGTTPAPLANLQPPSTITVTFNEPINLTSLSAGELKVNNVAATGFTLLSATSVSWNIPASAYGTGYELSNKVTISPDASGNQIRDVSGQSLSPYSYSFLTTNVAPSVKSSSLSGQVISPSPANVTEVVKFSQQMNTAQTTAANLVLLGIERNIQYSPTSFSWDPTDTTLTIKYVNLPEDAYSLTFSTSNFVDNVGIPLSSNYVVNFAVTLGTASFPTPLSAVPPLGDLIYTGSATHELATPTDVDSLTMALDAGETLSVIGTPTTAALRLNICVLGPHNNVITKATAPATGQNAVLQTAEVAKTGTYTIQIRDVAGNLGLYSIQAYLNSYVKQGTSNLSLSTATNISGSSIDLGSSGADRLAVVGSLATNPLTTGDAFVTSFNYILSQADILEVNEAGQVVNTIPITTGLWTSVGGVELSPYNNELYVGVTTSQPPSNGLNEVTGELLEIDPTTGNQLGTVSLPPDNWVNGNPSSTSYYPSSFAPAADGTFWLSQPNSNNIIHVSGSGQLLATYPTGNVQPYSPSVRADGEVYFTSDGPGTAGLYLLDPKSGSITLFATQIQPQYSSIAGTAGVWSADFVNGAQLFSNSGTLLQTVGSFGATQAQGDGSGNVWVANNNDGNVYLYDSSGNLLQTVSAPGVMGLTVWGVDNPNPAAQDTQDYYKFNLSAGQSATIVAQSLNGSKVQISLVDGKGTVLATGTGGSTNVATQIENFVASRGGTYYVQVSGDPGVQYSLAVTRGATFTIQPHNSYDTAQPLSGTKGALGYLAKPSATLYLLDDQLYGTSNPIWAVDPNTGALLAPSLSAPGIPLNNPFGLNLANDGTYLYYNNGSQSGDNTICKIDPSTGLVVTSGVLAGVPLLTGLAYYHGELYGTAGSSDNNQIYFIDPNTLTVMNTESTGISDSVDLVGLAGDPDRGVLWAVGQVSQGSGMLYEIDPSTGSVIKEGSSKPMGYDEDIAYADGELITSDSISFGSGGSQLDYYDPATLTEIKHVPVATQGYVSGLGGDGLGGTPNDDWYTVNVQAGQSLSLQSSTPSDQGGQFPNTASLKISLYDTFGNLVATGTKASDGRNETLHYNAPISGTYHVQISEDPGGWGEYYLAVNTRSYPSGGISGVVCNDLAGSGTYSTSDPGLGNWQVNVFNSSNVLVASQLTYGGGNFDFGGLAPGQYKVSETLQNGWTQTQPDWAPSLNVTVSAGQTTSSINFGNFQNISISGQAFNDLTGSGAYSSGDPGLSGWKIELLNDDGRVVTATTTDASGDYSFTNLGPGPYTIEEDLQRGWTETSPAAPGTYSVTPKSGSNQTALLFGNFQLVNVSGSIYNDLSGSGVRLSFDPPLSGWTVNLLNTQGNVVSSTKTDWFGNYLFSGVGIGSYQVSEVIPSGYVQTQPQFPVNYNFNTQSGQNVSGLVFGDHHAAVLTPSQVIDNGQPGYSETGSWSDGTGGYNGSDRIAKSVSSGTATATAQWSFSGIANGSYQVWVTFAGTRGYSTAAPFAVSDGTSSLGQSTVNESIPVTSFRQDQWQGIYGGIGWLDLGTFTIKSGTLNVVLQNLASGNDVEADGVLIVPQSNLDRFSLPAGSGSGGSSIGTLENSTSTSGSTTLASSGGNSPSVTLPGVSQPVNLSVQYDQGLDPAVTQSAPLASSAMSGSDM
ncbi:MAG TPA: SdrD B-like domain-containing protein, partial [Isosphaeraceae bacterium]|nr:SdrD B-like domain-containing protein [Isosphaeraceae bacterium]